MRHLTTLIVTIASLNVLAFALDDNEPPAEFELLSPEHYAILYETATTFDWEDAVDDRAVTYDLYYSGDDGIKVIKDLSESEYTFPEDDLVEGAAYHWWVIASDGSNETRSTAPGGTGEYTYWIFVIDTY